MTQQEVKERIAAGLRKAVQRRGETGTLGVNRVKQVVTSLDIIEEIEVTPKTPLEVEESILSGQISAYARRETIKRARKRARDVAATLRNLGYRLDYEVVPGRWVAIAYRQNPTTAMVTVYFTVRSEKDEFSRNAAREALLDHVNAGTHRVYFTVGEFERDSVIEVVKLAILNRMETHPHEFPTKLLNGEGVYANMFS